MLDVLLYLFEHYFYDDPDTLQDRDNLQARLVQAGFTAAEVSKAFEWLDGLDARRTAVAFPPQAEASPAVRLYASAEMQRLDLDCRGFLMFLLQSGILDPVQHEHVVDRAMALDQDDIDLDDLKWVVLMVLFNQPGQEAAFAWMESHLLAGSGASESVH